jgi:hypothetical protein
MSMIFLGARQLLQTYNSEAFIAMCIWEIFSETN